MDATKYIISLASRSIINYHPFSTNEKEYIILFNGIWAVIVLLALNIVIAQPLVGLSLLWTKYKISILD